LLVLFGGRSAEHDVSCVTASHVLAAADPARYDVRPVGITREGRWVVAEDAADALAAGRKALPAAVRAEGPELDPLPALVAEGGEQLVVFPLLHGPMGEDGTVQGLLELAGVPYVGSGVLGSALSMDKAKAKEVVAHRGIPQARHVALRVTDLSDETSARLLDELGAPVFVKPANMGSSIGVSKAGDPAAVQAALELAGSYDEWVVVEEAVEAREVEVAVLGNDHPRASVPGEVVPGAEFYDYDDKYHDGNADLLIPAPLSAEETAAVQALALEAFAALRAEGLARVDFFFDEGGRGFLLNEINTMPGFTPISMYPRLWEASGLSYPDLVDELVALALERHGRRAKHARTDH
jgi:D-alanine-D-alanine ligase